MGVFAPARTPPAIVERLGSEIARIVKEPATREKLATAGVEPMGLTGAEFTSFLAVERQR
jgi:tripartite-type tricarboxylate transporter receptor subunit TctC